MPSERASDGALRRTIIAVHERLRAEAEARKAGTPISKYRNGEPVYRVKAAGERT